MVKIVPTLKHEAYFMQKSGDLHKSPSLKVQRFSAFWKLETWCYPGDITLLMWDICSSVCYSPHHSLLPPVMQPNVIAIYQLSPGLALLIYMIHLAPVGIWGWDLWCIHSSCFWQPIWGRQCGSGKRRGPALRDQPLIGSSMCLLICKVMTWLTMCKILTLRILWQKCNYLPSQRSANFFYKEPESKYFRICRQ